MLNEIKRTDERLEKVFPPASVRPGILCVPSQFALPFVHEGRSYVFNTLTRQLVEGILPEQARAGEGEDDWIAARFLVPKGMDEYAVYLQALSKMRDAYRRPGVRGYIILPTTACNARCVYCFEQGMKQVTMMPETAEQTVRFIRQSHPGGTVKLIWFGGEPLMCPSVIDRICEGLREAGLPYRSFLISNGSLVTPEIIAKMKGEWHLRDIQVTMDGPEEVYRARKAYLSWQDQYHEVMRSVSRMSEAGIAVVVRIIVDEENLDSVPQLLDEMREAIRNKDHVGVYLDLVYAVRMGEHEAELQERCLEARRLIAQAGFGFPRDKKRGLKFRFWHCFADNEMRIIGPDGSLYACQHLCPESRFGDIWNGETDEAGKKAFCRMDQAREKCRNCLFLPECTPFSTCPVQGGQCRETQELLLMDSLRNLAEQAEYFKNG